MPPGKRTKSGNKRGGRKEDHNKDGGPAQKKRRSTPLLLAWVLAVLCLASIIYFAGKERPLPTPSADLAGGGPKVQDSPPDDLKAERQTSKTGVPHALEHSEAKSDRPSPKDNNTNLPPRDLSRVASAAVPVRPLRPEAVPSPDVSPKSSRVAIVIDDLGPDIIIARKFVSLPFPITLSVLPHQAHSREIAEMAHQAGREVILHMPMEPLSRKENPGQGALLLSMSGDQIKRNINSALDTSPFFDGMNNHMGSRVTADPQIMKAILTEIRGRGLFFIDSMTINGSVGWKVAQELKIPALKRDIFLDNDLSEDSIRSQIKRLVKIAKIRGVAIAIGHPHATTLGALQAEAAHFRKDGVEIVSARDLIKK